MLKHALTRKFIALMSLFSLMLCASAALAQSPVALGVAAAPTLITAARNAVIIARVHIVRQTPLLAPIQTPGQVATASCGAVYDAQVVQSFKGDAGPFQFFSAVAKDFDTLDRDYLVFIYDTRGPDKLATRRMLMSMGAKLGLVDASNLACLAVSGQNYYVPVAYQNVWTFNEDAGKRLGGEWLNQASRPDLQWCTSKLGHTNDFVQYWSDPGGIFTPIQDGYYFGAGPRPVVVSWESVQHLLERAVALSSTRGVIEC